MENMNVTLLPLEGKKKIISITTFDEARQIVCSYSYTSPLQVLILMDGSFMLIDEEGKLKGLEINEKATEIAHENNLIYPSDYIAGDVILVDDVDEFDALPYE
jgi:hypothetical protein